MPRPAALLAALLLVGCSGESPPAGSPPLPPVEEEAATTRGGDGSAITLNTLKAEHVTSLTGEQGCSFVDTNDGQTLLVAKGDVVPDERAFAVINHSGEIENLSTKDSGGYDGMVEGATFVGRGLTLRVTTDQERPGPTERVRHSASMLVQRADGASRTYRGNWTCGP